MKPFDRSSLTTSSARLCVIFPGALGDFICFLPALRILSRSGQVELYAHSEFADLVPAGVTVRSLESAEMTQLFLATALEDSAAHDQFGAYAAVYSWLGSQQPAFVQRLQAATLGRCKLFPFRPAVTEAQRSEPVIELRDEALRWCENFWTEHALAGRAVLTIAPGSGAREKNWPEEFFIAVAKEWRERTGGSAMLLVGPVEAARGGIDRLRQDCLAVSDLTLSQVAAVISRSAVYLGNDSGITHLAAAVGVPTVALFGPSDPHQWAPRGRRVTVISRQVHCSPCSNSTMKSCPHRACLSELSAEEVIDVMRQLPELASLTRGGAGITV
jgi:ADP-heptose:LPS heptosyltransferase